METFVQMLQPGMTVVDAGANIGFYALVAASLVGRAGCVHAFEPFPPVAARLSENLQINRLADVCLVHNAALGDKVGTADLYLASDDTEGNTITGPIDGGTSVQVPMATLDEHVSRWKLPRIDLIKADVEGAEPKLIAGAAGVLSAEHSPAIIMEFNPVALRSAGATCHSVQKSLERFGYETFFIEDFETGHGKVFNVLAAKPSHRARFAFLRSNQLIPFDARSHIRSS